MSKSRSRGPAPADPLDTLPIFTVIAGTPTDFGCLLCAEPTVDEPGELCQDCAGGVLTDRVDRMTGITKRRGRRAVA
ncbi:MAG TPA: hypothetical protein VIP77_08660 [Jiangellaceae bacterium]